jgi:hypothetical protein
MCVLPITRATDEGGNTHFNKITRHHVSEQYFLLNHGKERNMIIGSLDLKSIK